MIIPFQQLPDESRIWIYQANRSFTPEEQEQLKGQLTEFLTHWAAHGTGLQAGFELRYKRFIVIGLDQELHAASGCSIDTQVHFIQELEKQYEVDLLDKMNVSFRQGEYIAYKPLKDFRKMVKNKSVAPHTVVFNNLVNTKEEYGTSWEVPLEQSWHQRFL